MVAVVMVGGPGYCIVLYCIVLYCIVLYCIVLYCIVLCCIVLYCIVRYCIVLYCIVLYCIVLYCIVLYCMAKIYYYINQCDASVQYFVIFHADKFCMLSGKPIFTFTSAFISKNKSRSTMGQSL